MCHGASLWDLVAKRRSAAPVVSAQYRPFGTMDVLGCAATSGFCRSLGWLGHNRVRSTGNDDDNVLQPPVPVRMGDNVVCQF